MKKVFLYISIGIILLSIPVTVFLVGKNQEIRKRAAPASTLSFSPSTLRQKAGDVFPVEVKLDAATNQVGLIQLRIVYDPAYLEAQDIVNGPLAPTIQVSKKIDPNGKVSISIGAKDTLHPIVGTGTVAILTMKALKASALPISIKFTPSPDTAANAIEEGSSDVLIGRTPASVTILNADGSELALANTNASQNTSTDTASSSGTFTATPTITPALSPTLAASDSATATSSALTIVTPQNTEGVIIDKPTLHGKGIPGSTITLTIHSTPRTVTVTVDENGNWVYTPETPLESGPHTVTALATDPSTGATQTTTATFVVAKGGIGGSASESAIPVSGSVHSTILLVVIGTVLFVTGAFIPFVLL